MYNFQLSKIKLASASVVIAFALQVINASAQPGPGIAAINPPTGDFQIEGNLQANVPLSGKGDWLPGPAGSGSGGNVLNAAGVAVNSAISFHLTDVYASGSDNSFAGGLKFNDDPNNWSWISSPVGGKVDINNALFHFARSANGHQWVIVAADRLSNSGNAYIDFEFLQNTLTVNPPAKKKERHSVLPDQTTGEL